MPVLEVREMMKFAKMSMLHKSAGGWHAQEEQTMLVMELMGNSLRETLSRVDIGRDFVWCTASFLHQIQGDSRSSYFDHVVWELL